MNTEPLVAASKAMLRAPSWASAHYPITLLAYLAVTAIVITFAFQGTPRPINQIRLKPMMRGTTISMARS